MKRKLILKIFLGIIALVILLKFLSIVFIEPLVEGKIKEALRKSNRGYIVKIDKVRIYWIISRIKLIRITIGSEREQGSDRYLNGGIESIKLKGINLIKAIFKNDIYINQIHVSNIGIKGKIPFSVKSAPAIVSPINIRIGRIIFDRIDLMMENDSTAQSFSVKNGVLKVYDLQVEKQDTLSAGIVKQFDFGAEEFVTVSTDSMYSYTASGIVFYADSNALAVDSFFIQPNYTDYDFTSRHEFQTVRIEAGFSNIHARGFYAAEYLISGSLISSDIEIGKMDMKVFRDKRKEFRHINRLAFQEIIYNYPGTIQIDSIGLTNGNVTYAVHAEKANEPGSISFNEINAEIYNITNDTIYKTDSAFLELKGDALLMGKGKMTILLRGRIFDSHNTFSLNGTLSELEANELNPILEKNAFIYATSGNINSMNFSFTANNTKATGNMTLLYQGLDIAVKNKQTDDTTAFLEEFISLIVNRKVLDSNPIPGEDVREGTIDFERDPERFLFSYCFKSILTGIKSSFAKSPKVKKN